MKRTMTNYEDVYHKFIPVFRAQAANVMVTDFGMTQKKAASILNITQAAVNGYLTKKSRKNNVNIDSRDIRKFVSFIAKGDNVEAKRILCKSCQEFKNFECEMMLK